MVSVFSSSAIGREFELRSGQIKDYAISFYISPTVETEKVGCNASRHKKCTREGRKLFPHIVQGKHASISPPSLT
jgi:hypothetical protein